MALGTITQLTDTSQNTNLPQVASLKRTVSTVVGDASYPTGGTAITAQQLGLPTNLVYAKVVGIAGSASNNGAIAASFNGNKLQCWASAGTSPVGLVEVANAVNLSGLTFTVEAEGY